MYGLSLAQARRIAGTSTERNRQAAEGGGPGGGLSIDQGRAQRGGWVRRQAGGWIRGKGLVGDDTVEIAPGTLAAPGEYYAKGPGGRGAVINRHQAPIVNLALMRGGYTLDTLPRDGSALPLIEGALADWGGLDAVFSSINRPHMLQRGGWLSGDGDGLGDVRRLAAARLASYLHRFQRGGVVNLRGANPDLARYAILGARFGLGVSSGLRPGSITSSGNTSLHASGDALDIAGPADRMLAFARAVASRFGSGLDELIHTPLGFGISGGRRVAPYARADHFDHVHIGDRSVAGGGGGFGATTVPRVGIRGGGAVGRAAQRALDLSRAGANRMLEAAGFVPLADSSRTHGDGADPRVVAAFRRALAATRANPVERLALFEAGLVESGLRNLNYGDRDSVGALQQRPSQGWRGLMNPYRAALEFLQRALALRPWRGSAGQLAQAVQRSAFPGRYDQVAGQARQFLQGGGRVNLASRAIGLASRRRRDISTGAMFQQGADRLSRRQSGRFREFNRLERGIATDERRLSILERRQGLDEETLLNEDGTLNTEAIEKRAGEIDALAGIWEGIKRRRQDMRKIAQRIAGTYETIIKRLGIARTYAREPRYTAIGEQLGRQREALGTWRERVRELGFVVQEDDISLTALRNEARGVRGTRPEDRAGDRDTDAGGATTDTAADPGQRAPSVEEINAVAREHLAAFTQGRASLFSTSGSNFVARPLIGQALQDPSQQAAGLRNFGAFGAGDAQAAGFNPMTGLSGGQAGPAGRTVVQNITITEPPPDPHAFSRTLLHAAQVE